MLLNRDCFGGTEVKVFIDGVEHNCCFEADDEKGYAWVGVLNEEGQLRLDIVEPDIKPSDIFHEGVMVQKITGRVEFIFDEGTDIDKVREVNQYALNAGTFKSIESDFVYGDGRRATQVIKIDKRSSEVRFSDESEDSVTLTILNKPAV